MFFDLTYKKIVFVVSIVLLIGGTAFVTSSFTQQMHPLNGIMQYLGRTESNFSYWFFFKTPFGDPQHLAQAVQGTAVAAGTAASVPVLLYHGEGPATTTMPTAVFVDQMRSLKAAGWQTITIEQFQAFMEGKTALPDKSFLLSFDDGRTDTFYSVDPVLKDLGYTGVMFVITGFSMPNNGDLPTNSFYLSKSELDYMAASGRWELESHGTEDHRSYDVPTATSSAANPSFISGSHFLSNLFWLSDVGHMETPSEFSTRAENDLMNAKSTLQSDFGKPVIAFAYPFNDFGEDTVNFPAAEARLAAIVQSLYQFAFYQTWPGNGDTFNYPNPSEYFIKRIEPLATWSGADLLRILDGGRAKPLPYQATSFGIDWSTDWGILTPGTTLSLASASSTTGAAAFLDGTDLWKNYVMSANAHIDVGTLSLIALHTKNSTPYPVCAFSGNRIYLELHSGQTQTTFTGVPYTPPAPPATVQVAMTVNGNTVSCGAYGKSVQMNLPEIQLTGGVGASVWDPTAGAARVTLTQFSVQPL
ncbi:MAG: polysaccharide deacetylase family protein [Minisyncoccota bacterium]